MTTADPTGTPTTAASTDSAATSAGTMTFVFTDLEGSTRLLATLRDEYGDVLDQYRDLIGQVFAKHGGNELDRAGDGLFYGFPSARRAVQGALEVQGIMAEREWPGGATLRTRMGIHTGEAMTARDGYFGMDVHRAARIASAGHGGQVLLSQTTRDLVAQELPTGATLSDLGEHWLKDLAQAEHLYQLNVEGLPQAFPPLKSLVTLPNNLPRHLSSFVGRRTDVAEVRQLTTEAPLVTLIGSGGVGKTRLCLQVAAEMLDTFEDGAWLVELETLTDEKLVPQQVAVAMGVAEGSDADPREALIGHLRTRQALLILDNCEHLIDACAQLANELLRVAPGLRILATSREALGVPGERTFAVRPMSLPHSDRKIGAAALAEFEAVGLFVERARAADARFQLVDGNAADVLEICRRLDGIPLALELAAARVRALTVRQIAERLDDRFRLLTGGVRTVMPRHQTLRAAIDWSFDLLPDVEKTVLWRLSVFSGSFSLEAAEAVCSGDEVESFDVVDHLARLVEKSLVNRMEDHYRLLETVRGYAREHALAANETEGAYRRHRDWYLDFVRRAAPAFFRGPESTDWLDRLEAEHDNLRAALAWSLNEPGGGDVAEALVGGLWRFWEIRGYLAEGRDWLDRVLALTDGEISVSRADVLTGAGMLAAGQGDHAAAVRYHEQALAIHEQLGDKMSIQYAVHNLANAAMHQGNQERARELYERAVRMHGPNDPGIGFALVNLAEVIDRQGDYEAAAERFQEAITVVSAMGDPWAKAYALASYGQSAARKDDAATARARYDEALDIYRETGDKRGEARMLTSIAELAEAQGDQQSALTMLYDALQIRCALGDTPGICAALERLAGAAPEAESRRAARIMAASAGLRDQTGARLSLRDQATVDQQMARLQTTLGDDFNAAWREGRGSSVDEAVREAAGLVGK